MRDLITSMKAKVFCLLLESKHYLVCCRGTCNKAQYCMAFPTEIERKSARSSKATLIVNLVKGLACHQFGRWWTSSQGKWSAKPEDEKSQPSIHSVCLCPLQLSLSSMQGIL